MNDDCFVYCQLPSDPEDLAHAQSKLLISSQLLFFFYPQNILYWSVRVVCTIWHMVLQVVSSYTKFDMI